MQRGSNLCCLANPATSLITPPTCTVHTAALDSLTLADRQGVSMGVSGQLSASQHVRFHAQPRVAQRRLKMRCLGWRSVMHVHASCDMCATRGTEEHTIGREIRTP